MDPIDKAIAAIEAPSPKEQLSYRKAAKKFKVDRTTLARRHQGCQAPQDTQIANGRLLNPQQESELVSYIEDLTNDGLPPTKAMVQNFASEIAQKRVGEGWVTRFVHRNKDHLISKWVTGLDRTRSKADSRLKYKLYFDLIHRKIKEYNVEPCNMYNIDEKGFAVGIIGRSKRVFSRRKWEAKEVTGALQDGSREWITLLAAICADGTALPPGLIYASKSSTLRTNWVADIRAEGEGVFATSTPTGWSNNDVGIAWLEQVFDRYTKQKARNGRDWRLLILDGHASHVTKAFIDYCYAHRILLCVFPPHATHSLQPLDVVMFKPLSSAYKVELEAHLARGQGLVQMRKGDFFPLFWRAWRSSFRKDLIEKSFSATGIWPMDAEAVLKRFSEERPVTPPEQTSASTDDWQHLERLLRASVGTQFNTPLKKLSHVLHRFQVRNELLEFENKGLRHALVDKKTHKKKGKPLPLELDKDWHGGAVFWSPHRMDKAAELLAQKEQEEEAEKLQKATNKELREARKLVKQQELAKRKADREAKAEDRRLEKEEKAAKRERKKQERNSKKAVEQPQIGKRKASRAPAPKAKRQKRSGGAVEPAVVAPVVPPKVNSRGRTVNLPARYVQK